MKNNKIKELENLVRKLDITPTMFKNATEKYKNVGNYLVEHGINADMYPQGSFSLGTVVRPYRKSKDADYDLDFICLLSNDKDKTNPSYIKNVVGNQLKESDTYKKRLQPEYDRCWTIEYADDSNGIGFNIDIVPAVKENMDIVNKLILKGVPFDKASEAIAITNKTNKEYNWAKSNPKGLKIWFDEINRPFLESVKENQRMMLFEDNRSFYNSIEDVPDQLIRSPLQRAIQILKRHRDMYFCKSGNEDLKPISAIITVLVAEIAKSANYNWDIEEFLTYVVKELNVYSNILTLDESTFNNIYSNKKLIRRENGSWKLLNPVNPEDNLADSWNGNPKKAELFFKWIVSVQREFLDYFNKEDDKYLIALENAFGYDFVNDNISSSFKYNAKPKKIENGSKPWKKI